MKPKLLLCGEIGCGKSTLIKNALGKRIEQAGGFLTLREYDKHGALSSFSLAPASPFSRSESQRFISFGEYTVRNDSVFTTLGVELLKNAKNHAFSVADEFGGMELCIPEFYAALMRFLSDDTPCVGVIKTPTASKALQTRVPLEKDYRDKYEELFYRAVHSDVITIQHTTGHKDKGTEAVLNAWVSKYCPGREIDGVYNEKK